MRLGGLWKSIVELGLWYAAWNLLDYSKGLVWSVFTQTSLAADRAFLGTLGVMAIAGAAILGTLLVQDARRWFKGRHEQAVAPSSPRQSQFQTFFGGDELLKQLGAVEAWCGRFGNTAASIRDVSPVIMELNHLWTTLTELKGEYRGVWTLTRQNEVTMVADQLREASSALGRKDLEHTKAHIDGAVQNARSLITSLKSEPTR